MVPPGNLYPNSKFLKKFSHNVIWFLTYNFKTVHFSSKSCSQRYKLDYNFLVSLGGSLVQYRTSNSEVRVQVAHECLFVLKFSSRIWFPDINDNSHQNGAEIYLSKQDNSRELEIVFGRNLQLEASFTTLKKGFFSTKTISMLQKMTQRTNPVSSFLLLKYLKSNQRYSNRSQEKPLA